MADVLVNVSDNDSAGVVITQTGGGNLVSEAGGTDTYTIVLNSQPEATVNLAISFPASDLTVSGDTDGTYNTTFNTGNWNLPQTITLAAVNDRALEGNHAGTRTFQVCCCGTRAASRPRCWANQSSLCRPR